MYRKTSIALAVAVSLAASIAQAELVIGSGGKGNTYYSMVNSIVGVCSSDTLKLRNVESNGSDENLANLIKGSIHLAIVQADALQFEAMNDPRAGENDIKVLMVLHPEEMHVIARKDLKVGGYGLGSLKVGGSAAQGIEQLKDLKVGAWGGSYTTARAFNAQTHLGYEVVKFDKPEQAEAALRNKDIQAIIRVAGQEDGFTAKLVKTGDYQLLNVTPTLASSATFYVPARLNYGGGVAVPSLAAQALLVTSNFKSAAKKAEVSELKQCIISNMDEFREGGGHHSKWKEVKLDAPSARSFYEVLPTKSVQAAPTTQAAKRK